MFYNNTASLSYSDRERRTNNISNDIEQDIYISQIIVAVITSSNPEEWTASVMIPAYKGKGDPTECGFFSWN